MTSFDPHHWKCTPEYMPPIHPPARSNLNKYEGRCNTSTKTVKVAQQFYGIMFPHALTGYKMRGASGQSPVFDDLTTNQYFQNQVRKVGEEVGQGDKKLIPYHPDATRNRPLAEGRTDVGLSNFDRRNASYIRLKDKRAPKATPKTTNQLFMGPPPKETAGLWHPGICRDRAIWLHRKQQGMAGF